jgi:NAD(P)H-dependent FMN reductase
MTRVRLLALSGSTRAKSHNGTLVEIAAAAAERAGAEVRRIALRDFHLPLYDADLEAGDGMPGAAAELKKLFVAADGFIIASPEYNASVSAVLKNALDWISRPSGDDPSETELSLRAYRGKVAGIMSASPGAWGGVRGLAHLRQILNTVGVLVIAEQLAVPQAPNAFGTDGALVNPVHRSAIETIGARVVKLARAMRS